jgi:hypothetical protein
MHYGVDQAFRRSGLKSRIYLKYLGAARAHLISSTGCQDHLDPVHAGTVMQLFIIRLLYVIKLAT